MIKAGALRRPGLDRPVGIHMPVVFPLDVK